MLERIVNYGTMIGMAIAALLYFQSNFVSAENFVESQIQDQEDLIYELVIKQEDLKKEGLDLKSWEKAKLERARQRLQKLQNKK